MALALSAPLDFDHDDLLAEELLAIAELGEWGVKTSAFVPKAATGARKVHRSADYGAPNGNGNGNGGNGNNGYGSAAPAAGNNNGKFCLLPITIGLIIFIELCAHSTLLIR